VSLRFGKQFVCVDDRVQVQTRMLPIGGHALDVSNCKNLHSLPLAKRAPGNVASAARVVDVTCTEVLCVHCAVSAVQSPFSVNADAVV
jgi:hypothetical protein